MGIKASILITAYEKNLELPNVFYSISRQKTDFDFEVCFLDDCSYEDPKPIYDKYLQVQHKKGVRLKQHIGIRGNAFNFKTYRGFKNSYAHCYDLADKNSEILVVQSADVLWCSNDLLQKLVDATVGKTIPVCNVRNILVPQKMHTDWDACLRQIYEEFTVYEEYQGPTRKVVAWLVPFKRETLEEINYSEANGEYPLTMRPQRLGYQYVYRNDLRAIHQTHTKKPSVQAIFDYSLTSWDPSIHPEKVYYGS